MRCYKISNNYIEIMIISAIIKYCITKILDFYSFLGIYMVNYIISKLK